MEIITGVIQKAKKVVIYGPEGVGKSLLASRFPGALFIDTEGSTNGMNVARVPKPSSWEMLESLVRSAPNEMPKYRTLVIDTIDWAEQLCIKAVCDRYQKKGIEDFGYGNGYVYEKEEFGKFLNLLQDVVDKGMNVVLNAHAHIKKFEQPDEMASYDRWELKLGKKTGSQISPLVKEWADMVLFANYKTFTVATDKEGKKHKAQGGERVMYTTHHPCWDAKNRYDLPNELPLDYGAIAHLFEDNVIVQTPVQEIVPQQTFQPDLSGFEEVRSEPDIPEGIPKALADLMRANNVSESDIRLVCTQRGYISQDTRLADYPSDFVDGCLIGAWSQMLPLIRENQKVPF